jgi:hypothetical protein
MLVAEMHPIESVCVGLGTLVRRAHHHQRELWMVSRLKREVAGLALKRFREDNEAGIIGI